MKPILRSLMLIVTMFGLFGYLFYLATGSLPMNGYSQASTDQGRPNLERLSQMPALNSIEKESDDGEIRQWQDKDGVWHFSNQSASTPELAAE